MRASLLLMALLVTGPISTASADPAHFRAGITQMTVAADVPFDTLVWYPTEAAEIAWREQDFTIPATRDAAIATGEFPVVLLAHGGGLTGGSPLVLRELSADLARQGYIVIAPFHGKAGLRARPSQITQAFRAAMADNRIEPHAIPVRLGMIGFSLGGAVTLELAGAIPNPAHLLSYCSAHPEDVMSCGHAPDGNNPTSQQTSAPSVRPRPPTPLPLRAIILLDPFAVPFQREELAAVTMPVLLLRPAQSQMPGSANAMGLAAALPRPPRFQIIPGRHFIFTDVCEAAMASAQPEVCQDPPGVDRAAVHATVEAMIVNFLRENL